MSVVQGQEKELLLSASQENDPTQEPLQCKVDPLPTGTPSSQEIRLFRPVASSLCLGGQMRDSTVLGQGPGGQLPPWPLHSLRPCYSQRCGVWPSLLRSWPVVELRELIKLSLPTVLMLFLQEFIYILALMFAGHISGNSRELDAASLALSASNVTGYVVVLGLSSAADTLCPQNFGFKNYVRVGEVFQQGILILFVAILPVIALWLNSEPILLLLQQPPCVVRLSSQFLMIFTLYLPPLIVMTMLQKYLQAQSVVWVFAGTAFLLILLTALFCAFFVHGLNLGVYSVSVAMVMASYFSATFLVVYVKVRGLHKLTWGGWSFRSLDNWWPFLKLGLPGFFMVAFEWWIYEISLFISGSLSETALGVNTILVQLLTVMFMLAYGTGTAATVQVGNELGAGNTLRAKRASYVALALQLVVGSTIVVTLGLCHDVIAWLFTSDQDVIAETSYSIYPAIVLIFFDQIQGTISGVFRGAGLQLVAASINFFVFYVIGLPAGICLALLTDLGVFGMWIGLAFGTCSQACTFLVILFNLNWDKLTIKAMKNASGSSPSRSTSPSLRLTEMTDTEDELFESDSPLRDIAGNNDEEEPLLHTVVSEAPSKHTTTTSDGEGVEEMELVMYDLSEAPPNDTNHEEVESTFNPVPMSRRQKVKLVLCRGLIALIGLGMVVVSGVPAGLLRHPDLDVLCQSVDTCCSNYTHPARLDIVSMSSSNW